MALPFGFALIVTAKGPDSLSHLHIGTDFAASAKSWAELLPFLQLKSRKICTDHHESAMIDVLHRLGGLSALNTYHELEENFISHLTGEDYITLTNRMPGGFFIYHADHEGKLIYANQTMLHIFNCSTMEEFRELTGNSFKGIVHPDDLESVEQSIQKQIHRNTGDLDYVEYRIIQKGGGIRWLEDYGYFSKDDHGKDIFYVFVVDITERKQLQLEEQVRRLDMIEGLSIDYESIFYADLDTDKIQAYRISPRFAKKFKDNYTICTFQGFDTEYIQTWVLPEDRHIVKQATQPDYIRSRLAEHQFFHVNYRVVQHGKTKYLQLRIVNVGASDRISQIVIGYRSVDEEIISEMEQKKALADALTLAQSSNIAKNAFLSNMSHDIRTPMNAIVGFSALAKKYINDTQKVKNYLDMIETSSDHLLHLINNVLEISSIEAGKIHMEEDECNLLEILQQVQAAILPRAGAKSIAFSLNISGLKHYTVYTDRRRLGEIILRLTNNAVKYTESRGWIKLTVIELEKEEPEHCTYQFSVEDNGVGIGETFLKHIFEPFERQQNTTFSGVHGTGLGLTITKKYVDMMGGTIDIKSNVGLGSIFTVTLRLRTRSHQAKPFLRAKPVPIPSTSPRKILLVEDNKLNLEIEVELLQDMGFLVDTATDGSIAVEKIQNSQPGDYSLILMDIQMPIMDGYRATMAIRQLENPALASIPIVALSANTLEEDRIRSMECGMNAHLAKPVNMPQLMEMIEKILIAF